MTDPSPVPRRVTTPRWLDLRLVLGLALVVIAVLAGAVLVSRAAHTEPAVVADHDLAAGTVLQRSDLATVQAKLPASGRRAYASSVAGLVGRTLSEPVGGGEFVPVDSVTAAPARTTLTIPLGAQDAPTLRGGQRVELWLSSPSCTSVVLLRDVTVQQVHADNGGEFETGSGAQDIVIDVPSAMAGRVFAALSIDQVNIRAGVLQGATPAGSALPGVPTGGGLPSDLARCAGTAADR